MLHAVTECKTVQDLKLEDISPIEFLRFRIGRGEDEELPNLVQSIKKHGVLEPALVRRRKVRVTTGSDTRERFELVSGFRRYSACEKLGLSTIPCLLVDADDQTAFEISLVENLQRKNLDPIEEAEAFKLYVTNFGRGSVTRLAHKIGKSEEYVSHRLLLLGLPKTLIDRISRRLLNPSHATELIWLKAQDKQMKLANSVQKHYMSFREVRDVVHAINGEGIDVERAVDKVLKKREGVNKKSDAPSSMDPWPLWQESSKDKGRDDTIKIVDHAALVVRTALAGLDLLVQKAGDKPDLHAVLMRERLAIHGVLDDLIRAKIGFKKGPASEDYRQQPASCQSQ